MSHRHQKNAILRVLPLIGLLLLLAAVALGCSMVGIVHIGWHDMSTSPIFLNMRLPRVVVSMLVGAALSVCGATYQAVFRNPLTDPYVLGISSGASLGAALAILMGLGAWLWGIGACALAAAMLTILFIYRIASMGNRMHTTTLLLTGVCVTFLSSALISLIMVLHNDKMDSIIFWTMGSLASASWLDVALLAPIVLAGLAVVIYHSRDLNLLLTGSETAQSLGVEVEKVRRRLLLFTTLMVAFAVSCCGVIGFVGLVVPHAVRLVVGSDNRRVIPYSIVCGALLLLLCDTAARILLQPNELPVGSVTAMIGAPMFIYLLYKNKKGFGEI
ncbi:MAG: iron ABC transporter permease [Bacteroidales bacterium]|nr:iron ABC transporter permease [Bacteroidales bacterium]